MDAPGSSARRSSPSRPCRSSYDAMLEAIKPLQEEVKHRGLWAAHLPPDWGAAASARSSSA